MLLIEKMLTQANKLNNAIVLLYKCRFLYSLILAVLLFALPVQAQNSFQFEVPLMVNGGLAGNVVATIVEKVADGEKDTTVILNKERLRLLLGKYANEEQLDGWLQSSVFSGRSTLGSQGSIGVSAVAVEAGSQEVGEQAIASKNKDQASSTMSLNALRQNGLDIRFDPALLNIVSTVPIVGVQSISLRSRRVPNIENSYGSSNFSSGLNFNVTNTFNHRVTPGVDRGFEATRVAIDGFTNIGGFGGWSLFYEGDYQEDDEQEFARGDVTLLHDSYKQGVRYAFGDVRPSVSGLQTSPDLLGFSIERNYEDINPSRNIRPSGRSTFTLDRPSRVSFEVNGTIIETQQLDAGDYSVDDFPFIFGANSVRVIVDDGFSNVEVANFSAFSDLDLLAPGVINFGVSAGVQRLTGGGRTREYDDDIAVLGFYERGISQKLTVGVQAEISENSALLGSTAAYGSRLGLLGLEVAVSRRDDFNTGFSSTLSYRNDFEFKSDWVLQTNLQLDYQSENFGGLTSTDATSDRWGILSTISVSKAGYIFFLNGSTISVADSVTNSFSTGISKSFRLFNLSVDYRYSQTDDLEVDDNFTFNISGRFGRSSLRGQYQTSNDQTGLLWNGPFLTEAGQGSLNRINLIDNDELQSAELDASYIGSKFLFDASHLETKSQIIAGGNRGSATSLRFGTSVGFAGGQVAFGRPFNDGFIIANAHKNLRGKRMSITRTSRDGDLITSTKYLSSTLIPITSSYREQRYVVDVDDLPLGYDIGSGEIQVFPGFLAGYHYKVGSDAANTVIGKVLWPDNTPPSLIVGKIVPLNGGEEVVIFTNKTGRFVAERMLPGKYSIVFNDGYDDFSGEIEIQARDEPGLVRLDTITLEKVAL